MDLTNRKIEILDHIKNLRTKLEGLDTSLFTQNEQAHNISIAIGYLKSELVEIIEIELEFNKKVA